MQNTDQHKANDINPNHGCGKNIPKNDGKLPFFQANRHTVLALSACTQNFFRRAAKANNTEKTDRRQNEKAQRGSFCRNKHEIFL